MIIVGAINSTIEFDDLILTEMFLIKFDDLLLANMFVHLFIQTRKILKSCLDSSTWRQTTSMDWQSTGFQLVYRLYRR